MGTDSNFDSIILIQGKMINDSFKDWTYTHIWPGFLSATFEVTDEAQL